MATTTVRYKFLSAKEFSEIRFQGCYVTVQELREGIRNAKFKAKSGDHSGRNLNGLCLGNDYDLSIIDPKTNTPYSNESARITNNSSVLLRRVPGDRYRRCLQITPIQVKDDGELYSSSITATKPSTVVSQNSSISKAATKEEIDDLYGDDEFGGDVYVIPSKVVHAPPKRIDQDEENTKITLTPALGSWSQGAASTLTSNSSTGGGWDSRKRKQPCSSRPLPDGYVCHRCQKEGHFIQDCPTNGDPNYNFKRMRAYPAASTPSAAAVEGISSSISHSSSSSYAVVVPPELHCPLCRGVMRDAVLVKRCCLRSFCEGCIRDHVKKSKSCACGANADAGEGDFVPNVAVRKMISSILQRSRCSGSGSVGSNSCSTVIRM